MATVIPIDPVTRIEGHLKVQVTIDTVGGVQQVVDAWATGTLFRGFESILVGRDPNDAQHITERICGVCPVAHGLAAVLALDGAAKVTAPNNALIMRNLVAGANFVQSHILHFYHLSLPDFIDGPNMPPWQPSWKGDKRFNAATTAALVSHYVTAIDMTRKAHEMGAIFGGRLPHPPAYISGGFTSRITSSQITKFGAYITELLNFINNTYLPDAALLSKTYPDYYSRGKGFGNLLAFGVFDLNAAGTSKLLKRGRILAGTSAPQALDLAQITEQVTSSWYQDSTNNLPPTSGLTTPQYPKTKGYSWIKSPRYQGIPYETGPLARMAVNGDYGSGVSVLDRHMARAQETVKVANALKSWATQLLPNGPVYVRPTPPANATSIGLTEAPRGALGHWLKITNGKIGSYQIITPTCWNASPRDTKGVRGPVEQALIGTPVVNQAEPVEVVRVIHSFDPCLSCAVHVMRPAEDAKIYALGGIHELV